MQFNPYYDEKTRKCSQILSAVAKNMSVYKELPFIYKSNDITINGIIDFVAMNDQNIIIVDYKTTSASEKQLIDLYKPQLEIYAEAIRTAHPAKHIEKFIYSIVHEKLIKV